MVCIPKHCAIPKIYISNVHIISFNFVSICVMRNYIIVQSAVLKNNISIVATSNNHAFLSKTLRGKFCRALGCCHGIILYTEALVQRLERPTLTIKVFTFRTLFNSQHINYIIYSIYYAPNA